MKTLLLKLLIGFVLGFAAGNLFYAAFLQKPQTQVRKLKQKGRNNTQPIIIETQEK